MGAVMVAYLAEPGGRRRAGASVDLASVPTPCLARTLAGRARRFVTRRLGRGRPDRHDAQAPSRSTGLRMRATATSTVVMVVSTTTSASSGASQAYEMPVKSATSPARPSRRGPSGRGPRTPRAGCSPRPAGTRHSPRPWPAPGPARTRTGRWVPRRQSRRGGELRSHPADAFHVALPGRPVEAQLRREVLADLVAIEECHGTGTPIEQVLDQGPGDRGLSRTGQAAEQHDGPAWRGPRSSAQDLGGRRLRGDGPHRPPPGARERRDRSSSSAVRSADRAMVRVAPYASRTSGRDGDRQPAGTGPEGEKTGSPRGRPASRVSAHRGPGPPPPRPGSGRPNSPTPRAGAVAPPGSPAGRPPAGLPRGCRPPGRDRPAWARRRRRAP